MKAQVSYIVNAVETGQYVANPLLDFSIPYIKNDDIALNAGIQYGLIGLRSYSVLLGRLAAVLVVSALIWFYYRLRDGLARASA